MLFAASVLTQTDIQTDIQTVTQTVTPPRSHLKRRPT
jgi:hypothetical protein